MKILKSTNLLVNSNGKLLKWKDDGHVDIIPEAFMVQVEVDANQTITLPTANLTSYEDWRLYLYDENLNYITYNDYSGGDNQPLVTRSLAANTTYYIHIYEDGTSDTGNWLNIFLNGPGDGGAAPEEGYTILEVNTTLAGIYVSPHEDKWFKFTTGDAGEYTMGTDLGTFNYNYSVDWGDGNTTITNITTHDSVDRIHTYDDAGSYIIYIQGLFEAWGVNNDADLKLLISRVWSWGDVGLKLVNFYGCSALTNLPEGIGALDELGEGKLQDLLMASNFCRDCTSLVYIPYGTFFNASSVIDFDNAFYNCNSLTTFPQTTFRDTVSVKNFQGLFWKCDALATLPEKPFENCPNVTSFARVFRETAIVTFPANLFYRNLQETDYASIAISDMSEAFMNCDLLTTVPSGVFSSPQVDNLGLNPVKSSSFYRVFTYCDVLETIPSYLFHNQIYCTSLRAALSMCPILSHIPESCAEGCTSLIYAGGSVYDSTYGYARGFAAGSGIITVEPNCFKDCSSAQDFSYLFHNCDNLVEVKAGCFENCSGATSYYYAFGGSGALQTLPANLFTDSIIATNFGYTFYQCDLGSGQVSGYNIDEDLFRYNVLATTFQYCFYDNERILEIPEGLFKYNIEVTSFAYTFSQCSGLAQIPPKLFRYNAVVLLFNGVFRDCTSLKKIPVIIENEEEYGFFSFNSLAKSFSYAFMNCGLENDIDTDGETVLVWAIPQKTFWGNAEVQGTSSDTTSNGSFYYTFGVNTNLQGIPSNLFDSCLKAETFVGTFYGCTDEDFNSIPADLFYYNGNVSSFGSTFRNVPLTSIPEGLFRTNTRVSDFGYAFAGTDIVEVPEKLFGWGDNPITEEVGPTSSVTNFSRTFEGCANLTTLHPNLFKYNINVSSFQHTFSGCDSLVTIPDGLFAYNNITADFSYVFYSCDNLIDPGVGLFQNAQGALTFYRAFYASNRLVLDPDMFYDSTDPNIRNTRFSNKIMNFNDTFYKSSVPRTLDTYLEIFDAYPDGNLIGANDDSSGNYQPYLGIGCPPDVDRYVKITAKPDSTSGSYDIILTGGHATYNVDPPVDEGGITSLVKDTLIENVHINPGETHWYKFATHTGTGSSYTYYINLEFNPAGIPSELIGTAPDLWNCTYTYAPTTTNTFFRNDTFTDNWDIIPSTWGGPA